MKARKRTNERQDEIIRAAVHIIDGEGIHALTLMRISKELGVSDVALLRHFRSKEEIVEAMAQKVFYETVVEEDFDLSLGLERNLEGLMYHQFEAFQSWPESTAVLFQEEIFREFPAVREWFRDRREERHRRLADLVQKAQKLNLADASVDADAFAIAFMGAMRLAVMEWREGGRGEDLIAQVGRLVPLLARSVVVR